MVEGIGMGCMYITQKTYTYTYLLNKKDFPKSLRDHIKVRSTGMSFDSDGYIYGTPKVEHLYEDLIIHKGDILEVIMEEFPTEDKKFFVTLEIKEGKAIMIPWKKNS
jgi:hypothetical protein